MTSHSIVHFDGRLVPAHEATIRVFDPVVTRGPIVYETLRGYRSTQHSRLFLFRLEEHAARLRASMRTLRFRDIPDTDEVCARVLATVRANGWREDVHLRLFAYPLEQGGMGRAVTRAGLFVSGEPRPHKDVRPVSCQVSAWRRGGDEALPSRVKAMGIRMFARVAMIQAAEEGYDQIILLNERGQVAEGVSSNIFAVRRGELVTPPGTASILEGITRATLMQLAAEHGVRVREREVDRSELYACEEAFLCSTGQEILPIASIDRIALAHAAPGPITRLLTDAYATATRAGTAHREAWCTPADAS